MKLRNPYLVVILDLNDIIRDNRNGSLSDGESKFFVDIEPVEVAPISALQSNTNPIVNSQITGTTPVLAASGTTQV